MDDIDWDKAPEGTTHHVESTKYGFSYWLRKEGGRYHWVACGPEVQFNMELDAPWTDDYEDRALYILTERPPIETKLPNGLQWVEGATHWNHNYGGFFLNTNDNTISFDQGIWSGFAQIALEYWRRQPETIARHAGKPVAGVQKQQPKVEARPEPKRQVGWWT